MEKLLNKAIEYIVGEFRSSRTPRMDDQCRIYVERVFKKRNLLVKVQAERELAEKIGTDPVAVAEINAEYESYTLLSTHPEIPMIVARDVKEVMEALGLKETGNRQ